MPNHLPVPPTVTWLKSSQRHDYPAAASYLSLVLPEETITLIIAAMRSGSLSQHKAKDLLRASQLPLLEASNPHVAHDLAKVKAGKPLSPVLAIRGDAVGGRALLIADGYHRVCASVILDENCDVPAVIIDFP